MTDPSSRDSPAILPRPSYDATFTAFTQLGALRLNVARAIISLIDSKYQYVLAEATRTLSLQPDSHHGNEGGLWFGGTVIPRRQGICEVLISGNSSDLPESVVRYASGTIVVNDLSQDPHYRDRSYVTSGPKLKFYAGTPITTSDGTQIGAYCVFDTTGGRGLTADEEHFMRDMAKSAMDHLDALRIQADYKRRSKLVAGLESFVSGLSALPSLLDSADAQINTDARQQDVGAGEGDLEDTQVTLQGVKDDLREAPTTESQEKKTPAPPAGTKEAAQTMMWEKALSQGSQGMFARASNIIRQCSDYDGVAFFYMTIDQTSNKRRDYPEHLNSSGQEEPRSTNISQSAHVSWSPELPPEQQSDTVSDSEPVPAKSCPVLGSSVISEEADGETHSMERFTRRDLKFVLGKRFRAKTISLSKSGDSIVEGASSSGSGVEKSSAPEASDLTHPSMDSGVSQPKRRPRKSRVMALRKLSPDARSFVILPLWDYDRQRWFTCCICWSKSARKDVDLDGDLQYLRLFGNSIMISLSRLDAAFTERAKQSFVASISHELRSPLHGILGSADFLYESRLTRFQHEMVDSISSCGRTLLDTLEHVMDFARINSFSEPTKTTRLRKTPSNLVQENQTHVVQSRASVCDLVVLIEEVVEAVWIGFSGQSSPHSLEESLAPTSHLPGSGRHSDRGRLRIVLQVPYRKKWLVHMQAGALKRIIMNVFGNAIKYTVKGLIVLKVHVEDAQPHELRVCFSVIDTGRGISDDYQNNHLFKPFSQEDSLASGSGLGLSIVKQITNDLGGQVRLTSTRGSGTHVQVTLTMPTANSILSASSELRRVSPEEIRKDMAGLRIRVMCDEPSSLVEALRRAEVEQARSLKDLAAAWFGADVDIISSYEPDSAEILILLEPSLEFLKKVEAASLVSGDIGVILVAADSIEMSVLRSDERINASKLIIETIAQPYVPRLTSRVFSNSCLIIESALESLPKRSNTSRTAAMLLETAQLDVLRSTRFQRQLLGIQPLLA